MKRAQLLLASIAAVAASSFVIASAQGGVLGAHASAATKVQLRHTSLGSILVTSSGFTLYEFARDHRNEDSCVKIHDCAKAWPPLETSGKPVAGAGVKASLLSSIRLSTGANQVTYDGHALYTYVGDSGPGETGYVGFHQFGGAWYALNAAGAAVK